MHRFVSWIVLLVTLIVISRTCQGQLFKVKDDKSCSTKLASRYRVHSLLIGQMISNTLSNIANFVTCQERCNVDTVCQYAAYNAATKACLFFKENLANETISRLMSEGWKYGRVNPNGNILVYAASSTCTEIFCKESCLVGVEEQCEPALYHLPCKIPKRVFSTCKEAREYVRANPVLTISNKDGGVLDETNWIHLIVSGFDLGYKRCPADSEFTTISTAEGQYLKLNSDELHYTSQVIWDNVFVYNKVTGNLYSADMTQIGLHTYKYGFWNQLSVILLKSGRVTPRGVIITPYGTVQEKVGRYCFVRNYVDRRDRFILAPGVCKRRSEKRDQFHFTSIDGAVSFSHYDITVSSIDALINHVNYPSNPTLVGTLINFESAYNIDDNFCVRMQAYFVAPTTGTYTFGAVVDNFAKIFLSTDEAEENKDEISGTSLPKSLESGRRYYLELVGCEITGSDYFKVNVRLPDGTLVDPITYKYLEPLSAR